MDLYIDRHENRTAITDMAYYLEEREAMSLNIFTARRRDPENTWYRQLNENLWARKITGSNKK